mmetsp:Transcript_11598/g.43277  ORF Transcript_11598/g.43277 Transcript_11598/m.43277 type:complete len:344 (-) Transcript_11598:38-1069(-)
MGPVDAPGLLQHHDVHPQQADGVSQPRDGVVHAPLRRLHDLRDDVLAGLLQVLQALPERLLLVPRSVGGGVLPLPRREAHGVDAREVLASDDLAEVPAQGAVGAGEVVDLAELIRLVQHDVQLVIQPSERLGEHPERLAGRTGLVRVEEEQDHVSPFGEPLHDALEVVAPVPGVVLGQHAVARHGAVNHARAVHHHEVARPQALADLQAGLVHQTGAVVAQAREAQVWISDDAGAVSVSVLLSRRDDGEGVVGGRDASLLNVLLQHIVDKGALAGGVVAKHEHEGQLRHLVAVALQRTVCPIVQRLYTLQRRRAALHDLLLRAPCELYERKRRRERRRDSERS